MSNAAASAAPHVLVLAGPNGAGKSTAAASMLSWPLGISHFVNADVIAAGLSGFNPEATALSAGKIMLARLRELAASRVSFAFETTLASRSFAPWLEDLRSSGYSFDLFFFWLPAPELAIQRVATRVRAGGHHVPDETVRRRYRRGLANFFQLYEPLATSWRFYDNSSQAGPRLVARRSAADAAPVVSDPAVWSPVSADYRSRGYNDA